MRKKATNIFFLLFTIFVAFYNFLLGYPLYALFIVPLAIAQMTKGKKSDIFQFIGLFSVAIVILFFQEIYVGIMVFVVISCFFYTLNNKTIVNIVFIILSTSIIFIGSYINASQYLNKIVHAFLDASIYLVCATSIYLWIYQQIQEYNNKERQTARKYEELKDIFLETKSIASDVLELMKIKEGYTNADDSGKAR